VMMRARPCVAPAWAMMRVRKCFMCFMCAADFDNPTPKRCCKGPGRWAQTPKGWRKKPARRPRLSLPPKKTPCGYAATSAPHLGL
jgi:hypothetical protein